ncbi:MAG: T9SS type A sorting domain-containing protein, partial [bacterium]
VSNSDLFLVYDTITNLGCGTRRQIPNAGKVIMLGFGFEAVNRPASRPNYFSRVQLMNIMLNWLFTGIGVAESPPLYYPTGNFGIQPAVFTDRLVVESDRPVQIFLFDIMGRQVACIQTISNTTIWNTSLLPAGVYFARSDRFRCRSLVKIR